MTVLVAVREGGVDTQSVRVGHALARSLDEELAVVHVGSADDGTDPTDAAATVAADAISDALDDAEGTRALGRVGDPAPEILETATAESATYVVVGGRKRSPVGKSIFGSITQSVLLNAPCPVVTVPEVFDGEGADGPVVAAVDRSDRAAHVVREAATLATALDRPLHVVHVLTQREFVNLGRTTVSETGEGVTMDAVRAVAAEIAAEAIEAASVDAEAVGVVGTPEARLLEYADEQDASYVVASGRTQSAVGKVLFGSVTQAILLNADRPILTSMYRE